MAAVRKNEPVRIPVPGGKIIDEHSGLASDRRDDFSVAHMMAPPGWSEPPQTPEFDEVTIMVRGRLLVEQGGQRTELAPGESITVPRGTTVTYANPFENECEYWAICVPAFSVARAGR
jgi:mannose-6-phosphate isomerase-like protein (cupin superfamily)